MSDVRKQLLIIFSTAFCTVVAFTALGLNIMISNSCVKQVKKAEAERDSIENIYFNHLKTEH